MTTLLSIWAAALSTVLAVIKIWETWQSRVRLSITYSISASPEYGSSEITIQNPTNTPVMFNYWELLWLEKSLFREDIVDGRFPNRKVDFYGTIGSHSSWTLEFKDSEHFTWPDDHPGPRKTQIILLLHVAGRRKPIRIPLVR